MPGQPEQPAVAAPEQARLPRGVEVRPTPFFRFTGDNADEIQDAFATNLNLVSGGEVTTIDGQTIHTPGILGSAQDKIAARLEEINATGLALAGEREQFSGKLKGLRGPRAVREAEQEKRQQSRADNQDSAKARNQERAQKGRIRGLCAKEHISKESQDKYDRMLAIEEYLTANPDATDLKEIQKHIDELKWTKFDRKDMELVLAGATTAAQGYEEYKPLEIGRRKFEADFKTAEAKRKSNTEAMQVKLEEARKMAKDWEDRNAKFKKEDTPEQRRLKEDHALGEAVSKFLGDSYVPDPARLTQVGEELLKTNAKLEEKNKAAAVLAEGVNGKFAHWLITKVVPLFTSGLRKTTDALQDEQNQLVNPASRLKQPGAPKALVDMVNKVLAPDFNMAAVPTREKVLAETVTALLGKGTVTVEDSSKEESTITGDVPGIAGPEDVVAAEEPEAATAAPPFRSREVPGEHEQSPAPTPDQLADMAITGQLTLQQIRELPEDPAIADINDTLTDPDHFAAMEANLQASLQAAIDGKPGIPRNDLPLIVIDALRKVAPYVEGTYDPSREVIVSNFRTTLNTTLDRLLANETDPTKQDQLNAAKRLLALAETANKLRKG